MVILIIVSILNINLSASAIKIDRIEAEELRSGKNTELVLKAEKSKVFYFLNSQCPCSQSHFDHLNELQKKYTQIQFVGFHSNKNINKKFAMEYFKKFKIDFPIFLDKDLYYANIFRAVKTPHTFLLDKDGEVVFQGGATNSRNPKRASKFYLESALKSLVNKTKIETTYSKTIGCYIQR